MYINSNINPEVHGQPDILVCSGLRLIGCYEVTRILLYKTDSLVVAVDETLLHFVFR